MAISTPVERFVQRFNSQTGTTTFSPATTIQAGTVAVMIAGCNGASGLKTVASVSDSQGNTWTVDATVSHSTQACSIVHGRIATALTSSDTITITWASATSASLQVSVQEVSGLRAASVADVNTSGFSTTSGTAVSIGPTAGLAQASEIAFVGVQCSSTTATLDTPAGFSRPTTPDQTGMSIEYAIVNSTSAITFAANESASVNWAGVIVTYKDAVTASPTLSATQGQSAAIVRLPERVLAATQAQASTLARSVSRSLAATQAQAASLLRTPARVLSVTQGQNTALTRAAQRTLAAAQGSSAAISRLVGKVLQAAQSSAATISSFVSRPALLQDALMSDATLASASLDDGVAATANVSEFAFAQALVSDRNL